ncbi:dof zinc finger protein DOF3.1-like [Forsythia ovata]|uniref:Dof zinc finger protein DOF3.1-like n=1 Tax=Forsythia ovata TaxID=205694 RepID=A0ABD1TUC3_9LAMI
MYVNGSFSSLLGSSEGQFTDLLNGLSPNCSNMQSREQVGDQDPGSGHVPGHNMDLQLVLDGGNENNADGFLNIHSSGGGDSNCWSGGDGWADLAIYTPGSTFQ